MSLLTSKSISTENSLLLIVDIQSRLAPAIRNIEKVTRNNIALLKAASLLSVPVMFTEQCPDKLGFTDPRLLELIPNPNVIKKSHFDATVETDLLKGIDQSRRRLVIVTGTEAHVCVLQTVLGLLAANYEVALVSDAIGTRKKKDLTVSEIRLREAGAISVTTEMVLFEWLKRAETKEFRELLPTIKSLEN